MRKYPFLLIVLLPSLFVYPQDKNLKPYQFENGYVEKITKVINSAVESETLEKIYITEWGLKEVHIKHEKRNIKMIKKIEESNAVSILDGKWMINYNPDTKEGTKMENPFYDKMSSLDQSTLQNFGEQMKGAFNTTTTELPSENILGLDCKVTEAVSEIAGMKTTTKMWLYKNFVMKLQSDGMGISTSESVTVFKEGAKPESSVFTIPSDVKISEAKNNPLIKK